MEANTVKPTKLHAESKLGQPSSKPFRFSQLSGARQALVRLCQAIDYGYIQALRVRDSEPVLDPPPSAFKTVNLDSDESARKEADLADFELRDEFSRLFCQLDQIQNGTVHHVQIHRGLPIRIVIEAGLMPAQQRRL